MSYHSGVVRLHCELLYSLYYYYYYYYYYIALVIGEWRRRLKCVMIYNRRHVNKRSTNCSYCKIFVTEVSEYF